MVIERKHTNQPTQRGDIDAVIAWVEGADPIHIAKRQARDVTTSTTIIAGTDETRFTDNNEIVYCLTSIRRFAPWIRNIFLVTDEQIPKFLTPSRQAELGITIIDHKLIFHGMEWALPTFNSLSIESVLWRIPGLSDRFIYFNDDFFLLSDTAPEDFFIGDMPVLRGVFNSQKTYDPLRWAISRTMNVVAKKLLNINRSMSILQQMRGAQLVGAGSDFFKVGHSPYPLRREVFEAYYDEHPEKLSDNIQYPFRDAMQYAPTSLANHIEINNENAHLIPDESIMICFNRDRKSQVREKIGSIKKQASNFLCVQSLEQANKQDHALLVRLLDEFINEKPQNRRGQL